MNLRAFVVKSARALRLSTMNHNSKPGVCRAGSRFVPHWRAVMRTLFVALLVPVSLASCGGGGGGSDAPPPFAAGQANLTSTNAPTYASAVDVAARMAATMRIGPFLNSTPTLTDPGCGASGAGPAILTVTPSTGAVSGTVNFSNFDQCFGFGLNGTANVTGTLIGTQVDALNFTFTGLTFTATPGGQAYQMSGSASLQWTLAGGSSSYVMTLNATVSGASAFRLDNFRIDSQVVAGIENLLISGRLTMADGFVDITPTASRVELHVASTGLSNGSVQMTGATTIATAFFNGGGVPPTIVSIVPK